MKRFSVQGHNLRAGHGLGVAELAATARIFMIWTAVTRNALVWSALIWAGSPAQAGQMGLEEAFDRALKGNPGIRAVAERIEQARERVVQARAGYYPSLDIGVGAVSRDISRNEAAAASRRSETYDGFLTGKWVLFSGFERRYTLEAAQLGEIYETEGRDDLVRTLLAAVASSFHTAQLALANQAIAGANQKFYEGQLETARIKQAAGVGSLSDVLNVNTRMNQARIEMERYAAEYDVARSSLAALLGEDALASDLPEPAFPQDETPAEMDPPDPTAKVGHALDHRPDLARRRLEQEIAGAKARAARAKFYPELSINGGVGADRTNDPRFQAHDIENYVGVEVSYPLFAGGRDSAALREALRAEAEAGHSLADLKNQVVSQVRQDCFTVAAAQKQLALYRENAKLVKQNRDMVAKEYQAGKTDLINLNEVQNNLTETRQRMALALISLRQAWFELKAATNEINPEE